MEISKTINPGTMLEYVINEKKHVPVFIKIEYKPSDAEIKEAQTYRHILGKNVGTGRLSISGVVGPRSNGDCWGSCGQISDTIREAINAGEFIPNDAQGWTVPDVLSFLDMWDQYHLNDMHPECEHQRAAGWPQMARKMLTAYTYTLKNTVRADQERLKAEAIDRAASVPQGHTVGFSPLERRILKLESFITVPAPIEKELERFYEPTREGSIFPHKKDTAAGWTRYEEDARGLLGKPCDVCGYKYGHAWQLMPLSKNVLDTFQALAPTNKQPAWV